MQEIAAGSRNLTVRLNVVGNDEISLLQANNVINNIASQTNLLAMNAAIEAALIAAARRSLKLLPA